MIFTDFQGLCWDVSRILWEFLGLLKLSRIFANCLEFFWEFSGFV